MRRISSLMKKHSVTESEFANVSESSSDIQSQLNLKVDTVLSLTYNELLVLINSSSLKVGRKYTITDFATKHYVLDNDNPVADGIITGETEQLVVTAIASNKLDKAAISLSYPTDLIYYDVDNSNWTADKSFAISGTVVSGLKGVIYYRKDTKQNVECWFDFRNVKNRRWALNPTVYSAETTYAKFAIVKATDNKLYYSLVGSNTGNLPQALGAYWFLLLDQSLASDDKLAWKSTSHNFYAANPGDFGARTITVSVNSADYLDLLTFGSYYSYVKDLSLGKRETVTIISNSVFKTTDTISTCRSNLLGSNFYSNTISTNFFNNVIASDFFNNIIDSTFNNNEIGPYCISNNIAKSFYKNIIGADFYKNSIGEEFQLNNISPGFNQNNIGQDFKNNTFGSAVYQNIIRNAAYYNSIQSLFMHNVIADNFHKNTIGSQFSTNIIGSDCYSNIICSDFKTNTVGDYFHSNNFACGYFSQNTIGYNFINNLVMGTVNSVDLSTATHVGATYSKTIFERQDGTVKLSYYDNSDVLQVVAVTA